MKDLSIVICGQAGQGVQTLEEFLVGIIKLTGYHVFAANEFMSRIRGGMNSTEIRVSSERVAAFVDRIDLLIPLHIDAITHVKKRISSETYILGDPSTIKTNDSINKAKIIGIPLEEISKNVGGKIFSNMVTLGVISGVFNAPSEVGNGYISRQFNQKGKEVVEKNINAFLKGYEIGFKLKEEGKINFQLKRDPTVKEEVMINGNEAVAFGAIAGGCNFISAYPMSPSTGVLTVLAKYSSEFGIVIDQAEDEIAAINKVIGAWYAGGRGLASTSGGGFALMTEGVSLAGMIESPVVIAIAQRPAPATGLPTRTAQEDLNLALYSGHGEFPRIIYAPGTIQQAFLLTQRAFNLADELQIPIFILTDQYLVDSYYNIPKFDLSNLKVEHKFNKTKSDYKRYQFTESGISPRGIPNYGDGVVRVDSDEHDEMGHITEDLEFIRPEMVNKRLFKKMETMKKYYIGPEMIGPVDYETLVICWGSNYHIVKEAIQNLNHPNIGMLHYSQIYPLHPKTNELLSKAKKILIIENNATAQFANLIKLYGDYTIKPENKILKYNGAPFSVEEIMNAIKCRI